MWRRDQYLFHWYHCVHGWRHSLLLCQLCWWLSLWFRYVTTDTQKIGTVIDNGLLLSLDYPKAVHVKKIETLNSAGDVEYCLLPSSFCCFPWAWTVTFCPLSLKQWCTNIQNFKSNRTVTSVFDSIRNEHKYSKFSNTYRYRFIIYLTEWRQFFTLAAMPSNQQNLLLTMVQVLYLLEVFILAHYGPPSTETPTTEISHNIVVP